MKLLNFPKYIESEQEFKTCRSNDIKYFSYSINKYVLVIESSFYMLIV